MKTSNEVNKILPKLALALKSLGNVKKSADNPFFKSKYADLNTHLEVAEEALNAQGLMLLQPVGRDETGSFVESIVIDPESGQFVSSVMSLVLVKNDMQSAGSAVTYGRRYTLGALLSMQSEDDDGNAAVGNSPKSDVKPKSSFRNPAKLKSVGSEASTNSSSATTSETSTEEGWE